MDAVLSRLAESVKAAENRFGLDWRSSYSKIYCTQSGMAIAEVSREEVFDFLAKELGAARKPDILQETAFVLDIDRCPVRIEFLGSCDEKRLWAISSVVDVRREPSHSAELLTQMIMGESARLLKIEGDWYLARLGDDYHGWIRSWYVREESFRAISEYESKCNALVDANVTCIFTEPDEESIPVSDAVAGTKIISEISGNGFRKVILPGGRTGFMRSKDLVSLNAGRGPVRIRIVERAKRFLGIPYLWGGTSPKGFDCSGLVSRIFSMEGIRIPRDSDRQAQVGIFISREELEIAEPADLLFFGEEGKVSHVAIYLGSSLFIHSSGEVRLNSLELGDPRYDEKLASKLLFARSLLPRGLSPAQGL